MVIFWKWAKTCFDEFFDKIHSQICQKRYIRVNYMRGIHFLGYFWHLGLLKYQNGKFSIFRNFDLRLLLQTFLKNSKDHELYFSLILCRILCGIWIWGQICNMRHVWPIFWQKSEKSQVRKKFKILNFFKNFKISKGTWYGLCMIIKLQVSSFPTRCHTPLYTT